MKKIKKYYPIFFLLLSPFLAKSQKLNENILLEAGYTYFNRSFADIGIKYLIIKENLTIGANALIGVSDKKIFVVPEITATKYSDANDFPFPFARLSISPKTISPQVGYSYILGELGVGYGFAFDKSSLYKTNGFRV